MLRRIFGSKDEVAGQPEKPHMENLYYMWAYCSPNVILVIISSRMRKAGHVACMREREVCTGVCWEHLRKTVHLEDLDVSGRKVLKLIIEKWNGDSEWIGLA